MTSSLASRLGEIPGVASVVVDLDGFGRGIDVRLEPGADEAVVMERLRALLAAYGVKRDREPRVTRERPHAPLADIGVQISITPINSGARIEVATNTVKSFRIVAATPLAIAQGLSDAWCQVIGRVPVEIVGVSIDDEKRLTVTASDGEQEGTGSAEVTGGWIEAIAEAVGTALDDSGLPDLRRAAS